MKTLISVLLLATSVAFAQDKPKPAAPPPAPAPVVAPVLTDTEKLAYFKAHDELLAASQNAQAANQTATQKQAAVQDAVKALSDACGKDFSPSADAKGDLVCVANPKPEVKK